MHTIKDTPALLAEKIRTFKKLGFFTSETAEQVLERICRESENSYFGSVTGLQDHPFIDAVLLSFCTECVWFTEDWLMYGAAGKGYPDYAGVLENLSRISAGIFRPEQIKVSDCGYFDARDKCISLSFIQAGELHELIFCADGSALVLSFTEELNDYLGEYSFQYFRDPYGPCFVFFLNPGQKELLSATLNLSNANTYWLDKARFYQENERMHDAALCYQKAVSSFKGDFPFVFSEYAYFKEAQGDPEGAVELLRQGIAALQHNNHTKKSWWQEHMESRLRELEK